MGHVVGISQISKGADKYVTRKPWVIQDCMRIHAFVKKKCPGTYLRSIKYWRRYETKLNWNLYAFLMRNRGLISNLWSSTLQTRERVG